MLRKRSEEEGWREGGMSVRFEHGESWWQRIALDLGSLGCAAC